jgi:uncharacterized protein involved in exopolysaccharide biosynthesis
MRVYGSSPLFNYVELIFRSKRLFIVSIILATLATSALYFARSKNYTARMLIFMTGATTETLTAVDPSSQRDTFGFKITIFNIMLRNPQNIKNAMTEANLRRNMSAVEFTDFCNRVNSSLSPELIGNTYLGITCTWPNRDCEKILKGFYAYYYKFVIGETTVVSTTRTAMLTKLLKTYTEKHGHLDRLVRNYQINTMARKRMENFEQANQEFLTAKQNVERLGEQILSLQSERSAIVAKLSTTPRTIEESLTMNGPAQAPERLSAVQARDAAKTELDDLLVKFTPQNPKVKSAQEKFDQAQAKVNKIKKQADQGTTPTPGDVTSIKQAVNPQYQQLEQSRNEHDLALTRLQSDLKSARTQMAETDKRLRTAPDEALKLKAMTEDMGLYASMKGQLRGELETARENELRAKELQSEGMRVEIAPEAEMEKTGARGALLLGAGPVLGLIIAFCFSLLAESMDHSLRTPNEVEKYLNKPVLAVLPRMETNRKAAKGQLGSGDNNRPGLPS